MYILFCENPLEPNKVDTDYQEEFECAITNGFNTIIFNYDDLISNEIDKSIRKIKPVEAHTLVIYRGWMLTPLQYSKLYYSLSAKNFKLINSPKEYQNCHYLPDSLSFIVEHTPKTVFERFDNENSIERLIEKTKIFKNNPVILKDYVKSEKHDWETACFVPDASKIDKLKQTIKNLVELRDKYLNEGIVVREFVELNDLKIHSKSGMPLTEEYRLFFCNKTLIGIYDYWEEGEYKLSKPDTAEFENIAKSVQNNFFSMDIARKKTGELIIIELGDGQVAGLPDRLNKKEFYEKLKGCCIELCCR